MRSSSGPNRRKPVSRPDDRQHRPAQDQHAHGDQHQQDGEHRRVHRPLDQRGKGEHDDGDDQQRAADRFGDRAADEIAGQTPLAGGRARPELAHLGVGRLVRRALAQQVRDVGLRTVGLHPIDSTHSTLDSDAHDLEYSISSNRAGGTAMSRRRVSNPLALAVLSLPARAADASVRDLDDAAHPRQGAEHQAQLRLAVLGGRVAAQARPDHLARDDSRGTPPRAHGLRDHPGRRRRVRGLAVRTARDAGARLPLARGRAVADGRAAAGRRGAHARPARRSRCGASSPRWPRAARSATRSGCPRSSGSRARSGRDARAPNSTSSRPRRPHPLRRVRRHRRVAQAARTARRRHELRADHGRSGRPSRGGGPHPDRHAQRPTPERQTPGRCGNTGQGPYTRVEPLALLRGALTR